MLSIQYGDNALAESNAFELVIDNETDLAGLPEAVVTAAADEAAARNKAGKWVFTLDAPSRIPFLQYADNRNLREKVYKAYINKADNDNEFDNKEIVSKMVNLRLKKANLLGFNTYADFALDDRMAKTDANVNDLINRVWAYAIPRAKEEVADMQKIIDAEGGGFKLAPWDWWYYAEKVRKAKYDLNEDELKPYFSLDNVREGAFMVANKLYGITITELKDMPVYHPDVRACTTSVKPMYKTVRKYAPSFTTWQTSPNLPPILPLCLPSTKCKPFSTNSDMPCTACSPVATTPR